MFGDLVVILLFWVFVNFLLAVCWAGCWWLVGYVCCCCVLFAVLWCLHLFCLRGCLFTVVYFWCVVMGLLVVYCYYLVWCVSGWLCWLWWLLWVGLFSMILDGLMVWGLLWVAW